MLKGMFCIAVDIYGLLYIQGQIITKSLDDSVQTRGFEFSDKLDPFHISDIGECRLKRIRSFEELLTKLIVKVICHSFVINTAPFCRLLISK